MHPSLPHDIPNSRCRVELILPLTFAEEILNCRKVFLVKHYVLPELISANCSVQSPIHLKRKHIPSIAFEIVSRFLRLSDICGRRYWSVSTESLQMTYRRFFSGLSKAFSIQGKDLPLETRQPHFPAPNSDLNPFQATVILSVSLFQLEVFYCVG